MTRIFYDGQATQGAGGNGEIPTHQRLTTLKAVVEWIDKDIADHAKEFPGNPPVFVNGAMTALKNLKHFIDPSPPPVHNSGWDWFCPPCFPEKSGAYICVVAKSGDHPILALNLKLRYLEYVQGEDSFRGLEEGEHVPRWLGKTYAPSSDRHLSPSPSLPGEQVDEEANLRDIISRARVYLDQINDDNVHDPSVGLYRDNHLIQLIADIDDLPCAPPSAETGEQVEGQDVPDINVGDIFKAADNQPSVEADQQDTRKRGLKAFDDSMKNTLGELIHPEENPFAESEADQREVRQPLVDVLSGIPVAQAFKIAKWIDREVGMIGAKIKEQELIIFGIEEGAEQWKADYQNLKAIIAKTKPWPVGAYAPGNYFNTCIHCKKEFQGDKRACSCLECALSGYHVFITEIKAELATKDKEIECLIQSVENWEGKCHQAEIEIECLKADAEAYKKAAVLMGEEVNTLRSSGQIAASEYKRDMEIAKGERDDAKRATIDRLYQQILALGEPFSPAIREVFHKEMNALRKFTNNAKDNDASSSNKSSSQEQ